MCAAVVIDHGPGVRFLGARSGRTFTLEAFRVRGGEGSIYTLARQPGRLAKIYNEAQPSKHREKLETLAAITHQPLRKIAALPDELLIDSRGGLAGFVMPEVLGARPLHQLITPADRLKHFPHFSYANLVLVAENVARALWAAHSADIVVADVNTRNLLVMPNGMVRLVDCDSVQISTGRTHRCEVAMEEFLAPELHGVRLDRRARTHDHDAFALGVIVFQILVGGNHPFSGARHEGTILTIAEAIRRKQHMLRSSSDRGIFDHWRVMPDSLLSHEILDAFRSAFSQNLLARLLGRTRPSPEAWAALLAELHADLLSCPENQQHQHLLSRPCPWCRIEQRHAPLFQPTPQKPSARPQRRSWNVGGHAISTLVYLFQTLAGFAVWLMPHLLASWQHRPKLWLTVLLVAAVRLFWWW